MRRSLIALAALFAPLPLLPMPAHSQAAAPAPPAGTFRNPLKADGADPWLGYFRGWYYLATTSAVDVRLRRARRLGELRAAPDIQIWKDDDPGRSRDIWAPELFRFESPSGPRWYLHYTASNGTEPGHRMYVAQSRGDDPMGPYDFKAQITTDPDNAYYAIDGTVIAIGGAPKYFVWCGRPSPTGQGLFIARMDSPWSTVGPRTYLPADGFSCDVVREGPSVLVRNGRVFLFYSACPADTPDYRMGMMSAPQDADLTQPESWTQHPRMVFGRVDQHGVYGPGHNSFFTSPDGREDWIVYHAKPGTRVTYADRSTRAQRITWNKDGTPNLGLPLPLDAEIAEPSGTLGTSETQAG